MEAVISVLGLSDATFKYAYKYAHEKHKCVRKPSLPASLSTQLVSATLE